MHMLSKEAGTLNLELSIILQDPTQGVLRFRQNLILRQSGEAGAPHGCTPLNLIPQVGVVAWTVDVLAKVVHCCCGTRSLSGRSNSRYFGHKKDTGPMCQSQKSLCLNSLKILNFQKLLALDWSKSLRAEGCPGSSETLSLQGLGCNIICC